MGLTFAYASLSMLRKEHEKSKNWAKKSQKYPIFGDIYIFLRKYYQKSKNDKFLDLASFDLKIIIESFPLKGQKYFWNCQKIKNDVKKAFFVLIAIFLNFHKKWRNIFFKNLKMTSFSILPLVFYLGISYMSYFKCKSNFKNIEE